ncbi:MAG: cobaltochelatase subunit CobN, partial [Peptococcaceae bacterium]|nr:cobaltochelatase subunit CobN [Peptococcaceae bacterium]
MLNKKGLFLFWAMVALTVLFLNGRDGVAFSNQSTPPGETVPSLVYQAYTDGEGSFLFQDVKPGAHTVWVDVYSLPEEYRSGISGDFYVRVEPGQGSVAKAVYGLVLTASVEGGDISGSLFADANGNGRRDAGEPGLAGVAVIDRPVVNMLLISWPTEAPQLLLPMRSVHQRYPEVEFTARSTVQAEAYLAELPGLIGQADFIYISNVTPGPLEKKLLELKGELAKKTVAAYGSPYYSFDIMRLTSFADTRFVDKDGNPLTNDQIYSLFQSVSQAVYPKTSLGRLRELEQLYPKMADYLKAWEYRVADCASPENRAEMLLYFLQKTGYLYQAREPSPASLFGLYRNNKLYTSYSEYAAKYIDPARPTVGLTAWMATTWERGDLAHVDRLIDELEKRGLNALPLIAQGNPVYGTPTVLGMQRYFLDSAGRPRVEGVINLISFQLGGDSAKQVEQFLAANNILVFRAMTGTGQTEAQWEISDRGMDWTGVASQIALPELQGQIEPILVGATNSLIDPLSGLAVDLTDPLEERIDRLTGRVAKWVELRRLANSEKKVALIYYSYPPGKQNMGASYLDVPASLYEMLQLMDEKGYNVQGRPASQEELLSRMLEQGINVANWAPGVLEELSERSLLWDAEKYRAWYARLPELARKEVEEGPFGYIEAVAGLALQTGERKEIYTAIDKWKDSLVSTIGDITFTGKEQALAAVQEAGQALSRLLAGQAGWDQFCQAKEKFLALKVPGLCGWGPPPGNVMTVRRDGKEYIVIPGLKMGNTFVGPQPQRGYEADVSMLYHSQVVPPHHQYLAFYAYLQEEFGASAFVHVGRHGTYEWLPRKEVALSGADYPDICVGNVPSIYLYIMDGVGEVIHAKRRGLAVSISHLTPPLKGPELYGDLIDLKTTLEQYQTASPEAKGTVLETMRDMVKKLHLEIFLSGDPEELTGDKLAEEVEDYLRSLESSWMPLGLHVFGRDWSKDQVVTLASSMAGVPRLAAGGGKFVSAAQVLAGFSSRPVEEFAGALYDGKPVDELVQEIVEEAVQRSQVVTDQDKERLRQALALVAGDLANIKVSPAREREMLLKALSGGYIPAAPGNDPLRNPAALPTGGNLYGLDPGKIPSVDRKIELTPDRQIKLTHPMIKSPSR